MASETRAAEPEREQSHAEPLPAGPMSKRRQKKMIIAVAVIAVAIVVVIWGWSATGGSFLSVAEIVDASVSSVPQKYLGKIDVRGVVSGWSGAGDTEFRLVDSDDASKWIEVTAASALPEGFENGKSVVVTGELASTLPLRMSATGITVGCASKY